MSDPEDSDVEWTESMSDDERVRRLRRVLKDEAIPALRQLLTFVEVETPEAVGTPPEIRRVLEACWDTLKITDYTY